MFAVNFPQITVPSSELDVMIGLVGLLILIAGTCFYKLTVMAPGFYLVHWSLQSMEIFWGCHLRVQLSLR